MDYEKLIKIRNENNKFAQFLGMKTVEIQEGYAKATVSVTDQYLNPQGAVHGGLLFALADLAGGSAACSRGDYIATLNSDFHYLRAGLNVTTLYAEAKEIKYGKRAMIFDIKVTDQTEKTLATGVFTFMSIGKMKL